jgi:myo-inositol-1(or 4)-monophosphatase
MALQIPQSPTDPVLQPLLEGAIAAARAAAIPVMELFQSSYAVWDKGEDGEVQRVRSGDAVSNPLTEADLAADRVLHELLLDLLPGSGWLSEETGDSPERLTKDAVWIVDPIDGTREFTQGEPEFAISIALSLRGEVVLGVLLNPAQDELFVGRIGGGVFRNGERLPPSARTGLEGAVLLASRTETRRGDFEPFREILEIREVGSTAYKLGLVATGEGDAYFTRKPRNEWDVAAGILLCREAGMTVTDLGGEEHTFNRPDPLCRGVVACAPGVYGPVFGLIEEIGTLE